MVGAEVFDDSGLDNSSGNDSIESNGSDIEF